MTIPTQDSYFALYGGPDLPKERETPRDGVFDLENFDSAIYRILS